jgi:hypothetical protein
LQPCCEIPSRARLAALPGACVSSSDRSCSLRRPSRSSPSASRSLSTPTRGISASCACNLDSACRRRVFGRRHPPEPHGTCGHPGRRRRRRPRSGPAAAALALGLPAHPRAAGHRSLGHDDQARTLRRATALADGFAANLNDELDVRIEAQTMATIPRTQRPVRYQPPCPTRRRRPGPRGDARAACDRGRHPRCRMNHAQNEGAMRCALDPTEKLGGEE